MAAARYISRRLKYANVDLKCSQSIKPCQQIIAGSCFKYRKITRRWPEFKGSIISTIEHT